MRTNLIRPKLKDVHIDDNNEKESYFLDSRIDFNLPPKRKLLIKDNLSSNKSE
jgi:hypothetical protein